MSNPLDYKASHRRNLPHIQPPGATLFVTFRLTGSLPLTTLQRWQEEVKAREALIARWPLQEQLERRYLEEKRFFGRYDAELDGAACGPAWLRDPAIATLVAEAMHSRDGQVYDLEAFTVMPNHVHVVFTPLLNEDGGFYSLSWIMHGLKKKTAWDVNSILGRMGAFWQSESYDHYVRDPAELVRIVNYVLNNPVKAGLVDSWEAWPWTYWWYAAE